MTRRILNIAIVTLTVGLTAILASGCGDSDSNGKAEQAASTERQASAEAFPDSKSCPEKSPSFSVDVGVVNLLPWAMKMKAGDYTCDDWSGIDTPGKAINGQVVQSGEMRTFRLEPRMYRTRNWTMEFGPDGGGTYGRADISIPQTRLPGEPFSVRVLRPNVSGPQYFPSPAPVSDCRFAKVNTINTRAAPETPISDYPRRGADQTIILVSREGHFNLAVCFAR